MKIKLVLVTCVSGDEDGTFISGDEDGMFISGDEDGMFISGDEDVRGGVKIVYLLRHLDFIDLEKQK